MGETGVADNSDPANIYFNPANVIGPARVYAQGSHWKLEPILADDLWTGGGSAGVSLERDESRVSTLAADLSYGRFDYGTSIATDPAGNPLGEYHSYEQFFSLALGGCVALSDSWDLRIGAAGKRWTANYGPAQFGGGPPYEFDAFAFDVGATLALRTTLEAWSVMPAAAVAIVNAGPDYDTPDFGSDPLPTRFHFGASVRVDSPTRRILGADVPVVAMVYNTEAVERFHDEDFSWGIGAELAVMQILFVRAGVSDYKEEDEFDQPVTVSGWGFGLGVPAGRIRARFDYTKTNTDFDDDKFGFAVDWLL
jgi:hypothetical protein